MRHDFGSCCHSAQTRVGYKEIRKRTLQDHDSHALIGLEFPSKFVQFLGQNFIKKINRRVINGYERDSRIKRVSKTLVIRIWHWE